MAAILKVQKKPTKKPEPDVKAVFLSFFFFVHLPLLVQMKIGGLGGGRRRRRRREGCFSSALISSSSFSSLQIFQIRPEVAQTTLFFSLFGSVPL